MGELLNRTLQLEILNVLAEAYPNGRNVKQTFGEILSPLTVNIAYLEQHDLIDVGWFNDLSLGARPVTAKINARGLDLLANDGGLTAILSVVTIKIHEETIKDLMIDRVEKSVSDQTMKKKLIDQIKALPADMTKAAMVEAMKGGLGQIPNIAEWIMAFAK